MKSAAPVGVGIVYVGCEYRGGLLQFAGGLRCGGFNEYRYLGHVDIYIT